METEQIQGSKAYAPSKHSGTQSWDVILAALTDPSVIHGIFLAVLTVPTVILVTFLAAHRSKGYPWDLCFLLQSATGQPNWIASPLA